MAKSEWTIIDGKMIAGGIATSPHSGIGDIRNMNIADVPGVAMNGKTLAQYSPPTVADQEFTVVTTPTNRIILADNNYAWGDNTGAKRAVRFTSTTTLPGGLTAGTIYFLKVENETNKFYLVYDDYALTSQVTISSSGTGTHTIHSVDIGLVKSVAVDDNNNEIYFSDDNSRVWRIATPVECLTGNDNASNDLVVWKNHLFSFAPTAIDVYNLTAKTWDNDWDTTITTLSNGHFAIVGQDDAIYFCNGVNVGSIIEVAGATFASTNSATYSFNNSALDLPFRSERLTELGAELAISTVDGKLYFWDRSSPSFRLPVTFGEEINEMITVNNLIYVFQNDSRQISVTNGTSIQDVKRIPDAITNQFSSGVTLYFGHPVRVANKILFGVYGVADASAIWSLDINTGALSIENIISTGSYGTTNNALQIKFIGSLTTTSIYYVFWQDLAETQTNGIDILKDTTFADGLISRLETPFYAIGTRDNPITLDKFEVVFDRPLATTSGSENVRLSYRKSLGDSFTALSTLAGADNANKTIYKWDLGIIVTDSIQFRVETETASGSTRTLCRMREIRFK